jgi:hypothetical protein
MATIILIDEQPSLQQELSALLQDITPLDILSVNSADLEDVLSTGQADLALTGQANASNNLAVLQCLDDHQIPTIVHGEINKQEAFKLDSYAIFFHSNQPNNAAMGEVIKDALNHLEGAHISGVSLPSFLQLIELDHKTCTLQIKSASLRGVLYFIDGEIINAYTEGKSGEEAALEVIGWNSVTINLHASCRQVDKKIESPLGFLLIESSRQNDEKKKKASKPSDQPPSQATPEEKQRSTEIPPHLEKICQRLSAAISELIPDNRMLITLAEGLVIAEKDSDPSLNELTIQTSLHVNSLNDLLKYTGPQYILLHHTKDKKLLIIPGTEIIVGLEIAAETPTQGIAASLIPLFEGH